MNREHLSRAWRGTWRHAIGIALASVLGISTASAPVFGASTAQHARTAGPHVPTFDRAVLATRAGDAELLVDGKPYFFWGAAFFYERIPATRWRASLLALRALGVNTIDLYVPWNWHELRDGEFDFDGRTNPQRDLRGLLRLIRALDFRIVVRPGPVIRNEWRNGGYPAWLLARPAYGMPLHDILEGRYPATATLQNARSDDAAAQWLANTVHRRYAARWLRTALAQFRPVADRVIAVALDDDQGAYIDNQTWPAPHFQRYLRLLAATVRGVVGPSLPLFINTYEMKVTASAPVWAMGNWYQSDAYAIGEHDRASLEYATGLLQTQTRGPVAISEFQAGWLAAPEDPAPRPADPANTTLALHTLLSMGARGVIDFPMQDTVNPAGWEAPFANVDYAWDAALDVGLRPSPRWAPTARFGALVRANGAALATARRVADGAIASLISAPDPRLMTNDAVFAIVARTQDAQLRCRALRLTCDVVDLRYGSDARLARYAFIVVPNGAGIPPLGAAVRAKLARYAARGGRIVGAPRRVAHPHAGGIADATLMVNAHGTPFLDIVNYTTHAHAVARTRIVLPDGRAFIVGPLVVRARDARLLRGDERGRLMPVPAAPIRYVEPRPCVPKAFAAARSAPPRVGDDRAHDGTRRLTLGNGRVNLILAPDGGARAFVFGPSSDSCETANAFTAVGALRDDVEIQPPLSTTDKIGAYTRSFPAGTFNRSYRLTQRRIERDVALVSLTYAAPDVVPNGATFVRAVALRRNERAFTVAEQLIVAPGTRADEQRLVRYDSFDTRGKIVLDGRRDGAVGFFDPLRHSVAIVTWPASTVEDAQLIPERTSTVVRLRFAPGIVRTRYALDPAFSLAAAAAELEQERAVVSTNRSKSRGRGEMVDAVASKATE